MDNITNNDYIYDKQNQIVKFISTKKFNKRIGCLENFFSIFFTRGAFVYKDTDINIDRFINAMSFSFIDFSFILSTLYSDDTGLFAAYEGKDYSEQLEIEVVNESIENIILDNILPKRIICNEQFQGFSPSFNEFKLKMGVFKLSIFKDGFTIGYNFNHTLFDHSSIVCYLKYLSHLYTFGLGSEQFKLSIPQIFDASSINFINPFNSLDQVKEYSSKVLRYCYEPTSNIGRNINENDNLVNKTTIHVKFNLDEIDNLKSSGDGLSRNDIISAILIKLYNLNDNIDDDDKYFTYGYTVNIRRLLKLDESNTIGNLIHQRRNPIKIKEIKEKSILELAIINRNHVKSISYEDFLMFLGMCKLISQSNQKVIEYYNEPKDYITRSTNWTCFDNYESILFDKSSPISLRHYSLASVNINVISFDTDLATGKKYFTTQISIPSTYINKIKQYADYIKLYSIE